jgi:hypothetical protein
LFENLFKKLFLMLTPAAEEYHSSRSSRLALSEAPTATINNSKIAPSQAGF